MNMTTSNLETIWQQLDDACGALDNATINIASIAKLPSDIKERAAQIDFSAIVALKNEIELLLEERKELNR